jgi:hypothetical protein
VKELSWEEQEIFLRRQLEASVEAIREKLATSYPDYPFLTEWEPEILKKSLKAWVFALSGEQNYLLGIDDFTLTISLIELGKPLQITGFSANTQTEIRINQNGIIRNGYRIKQKNTADAFSYRQSMNELEDWLIQFKGLKTYAYEAPSNSSVTITQLLDAMLI